MRARGYFWIVAIVYNNNNKFFTVVVLCMPYGDEKLEACVHPL
jgi:hypothetical protein